MIKGYWFFFLLFSSSILFGQNISMSNGSSSQCSGTFYDNGGSGSNYSNNQTLTYTICPSTPGQSVSVNFTAFNTESGFDFLYVYSGNSTSSQLLGVYSGTTSPGTLTSYATNGCLTFYFTSDGSTTKAGWTAAISCVTPPTTPLTNLLISNTTTSACSGTFYDTGGSGSNYTNNQSFTYTICPSTPGQSVSVNFTAFNTESGFDFLYVYSGNSTSSQLLGVYSGTTSPGTLTSYSSDGCLTFYFKSDGSTNNSGWAATISCVTPPSSPLSNLLISNTTASACSGTFYDTGGNGSNYLNNQDITYTICPSTPGAKVKLVFSSFSLESNFDFMYVYDGNSTAAPSLGVYTATTSPGTVQATSSNSSGCITIRFTSDGGTNSTGWAAAISCVVPCQSITSNLVSSNPAPNASGIIQICQGQSVTFNGSGTFSNSGTGASYVWSFGNGATANGATASYTFNTAGAYTVNLNITDPNGCTNSNLINKVVQVSTTPTITTSVSPNPICVGQSANLSASVTMTPYVQNCTPPVSGTTFLPDGSGVSYQTPITVNCFASTQTVQSANDIQNICVTMEHSYMGDLQIELICPNGQTVILKSYANGGGGTYLGCPIDNTTGGPGTGRTYCFTPTATTLLTAGTTSNCGTPSGASVNAGNYMPTQALSGFIGCPLNGQWTIKVTDNLAADDGYIFNWDVNFNSALQPAATSFTPTIVSQGWVNTAGLTSTGTTTASVTPTTVGSNCYTYSLTDNFGCTYPQTQCITVNAGTSPTFTQLGPYCLGVIPGVLPTTSSNGINGTWNPSTISTSTAGPTTYTFTPTSGQCASPTTMTVVVNAPPILTVNSPTLCTGTNATITATPNPVGTYIYTWTVPSGATNPGNTPSFTTAIAGTYTVTVGTNTTPSCSSSSAIGTLTISSNTTPTFDPVGPYCSGTTISALPTTSTNGISGTWSPAINNTATTTYTFTPTTTAAPVCATTATTFITINPTTSSITNTTICANQLPYIWNGLTFNSAGTQTATLVSVAGCDSMATLNLSINSPNVSINTTLSTINSSQSTQLTASGAPTGGTYSWSPSTSLNTSTGNVVIASPTSTTTYTVTYTVNGCVATATTTITVNPVTVTVNSETICSGSSATLTATPNILGGSYLWSPGGQTTQSITVSPTTNTVYSVVYTLNGVSTNSVIGTVTVNPTPTISVNNPTICSGQSASIIATASPSGGTYLWTLGGQTTSTINVSPLSTTTYNVTYTLNNCPSTVTSTVNVNPQPTVTISNQTICSGQQVTLTPTTNPTGGTFLWSNNQSTPSITVSPTTTTTYSVSYNLNNCIATATGTVAVNPIPSVSVTTDTICIGQTGSITGSGSPAGGTYLWTTGGQTTPSISASPTNTTSYSVTYTLNGCTSTAATGTIVVNTIPTVTIANDTICNGQGGQLVAVPSVPGGAFSWSPGGQTGSTITDSPSATSSYSVVYTLNGCSSAPAQGMIVLTPTPVVGFTADNLSGCAPLNVNFTSTSSTSGSSQIWTLGNGIVLNGSTANYTFNEGGCYDVTLSITENGCIGTATLQDYICIEEIPTASFAISPNTFTEETQSISFVNNSVGAIGYSWNFSDGFTSYNENPNHVFHNTTMGYLVTLTASSSLGCTDETQVFISYTEGELFYIPNTFTPDGDGFNQTFKPIFTSGFDPFNFVMLIYNRWGELIFETHDANRGWDGSYGMDGRDVQQGTYTYKITYKNPILDERKTVVGHISLIK